MTTRKGKGTWRIVALCVSGIAAVALLALGWQWLGGVMVEEVEIRGSNHAAESEIRSLVPLDSTIALLDVVPDSVAADVRRHPWVREAQVRRWPTGRVIVRVEERRPAALVVAKGGRLSHYLDGEGYAMPLKSDAVYDVPPISGDVPAYRQSEQVAQPLREFLAALQVVPREVSSLIGEVELRADEVWVRTLPSAGGESIPVRLGKSDFQNRLARLHGFWHQAVQSQPDKRFASVDLRFNSQVVTRESAIAR